MRHGRLDCADLGLCQGRLRPCVRAACSEGPFTDEFAFELSERGEDAEGQAPGRGCRVDLRALCSAALTGLTPARADDYVAGMNGAPDNHALSERIAVLEERMNTMQAEYRTDIARLAEDMARRETRLIVTIVATVIGGGGLAVAFLAFLIGLPG